MTCPLNDAEKSDNRFYLAELGRKVRQKNVPVKGTIEITARCNLNCVHCYIPRTASEKAAREEITTHEVLEVIDSAAEAGCLSLLFTGGEPLLRPDFSELYIRAKERGMLVTVFTNGTLLNDELLELFGSYPPYKMEISIYGITRNTYEKITRTAGSFARCIKAVEKLVDRGVHLGLKTMMLSINLHEMPAIQEFAGSLGLDFRFDASISHRLDGDAIPTAYRVAVEDAVGFEIRDLNRRAAWLRELERVREIRLTVDSPACGAGISNFHVTHDALLQPCLMVPYHAYDLRRGDFRSGWKESTTRFFRKNPLPSRCSTCSALTLCPKCPGESMLTPDSNQEIDDYACAIGRARYNLMRSIFPEEFGTHDYTQQQDN